MTVISNAHGRSKIYLKMEYIINFRVSQKSVCTCFVASTGTLKFSQTDGIKITL